jgi:Sodium/hydrogen exchanger family
MPVIVISVTAFLAVLFFPHLGHAAATGPATEFGPILLGLAILVLGAKLGGILVSRWGQPAVLGELLFGIALANLYPLFAGTAGLEFVRSNTSLRFLAEIGVLLLLFDVGLEVDLRAFARVGPSAVLVAVIGVIVPFFWVGEQRCGFCQIYQLSYIFSSAPLSLPPASGSPCGFSKISA